MWIVALALRRPYTFTVMAILIVHHGGGHDLAGWPTDIFPDINIPVVSVIWSYPGVAPEEMETRFCTVSERAMTTTVNDIEHIESQSLQRRRRSSRSSSTRGPTWTRASRRSPPSARRCCKIMPPGTTPPLIIQYSASNVPILQLGVSSKTLTEQQILRLRPQLHPHPAGHGARGAGSAALRRQGAADHGRPRPDEALREGALARPTSMHAINAQNLILPSGTEKIGDREYNVRLNSSPLAWQNSTTCRSSRSTARWSTSAMSANVRDGYAVQQNIVTQNGVRAALLIDPQKRQRLDARHRQPRQGRRCRRSRPTLPHVADADAAVRPVDLRPRRHQRRAARGRHRGRA